MDKYKQNRYGHRERLRMRYQLGGEEAMDDTALLEMFLGQIIPQKDIKETVYELFNRYHSLEGIFSASAEELMQVKNIGETVSSIMLAANDIMNFDDSRVSTVNLCTLEEREKYILERFSDAKRDSVLFIALSNNGDICYTRIMEAAAQISKGMKNELLSLLLNSRGANLIIALYSDKMEPIESRIYFFSEIKSIINTIGVRLADAAISDGKEIRLLSRTSYDSMLQ